MKKNIIFPLLPLLLSSCIDNITPPLIITGAVTNIDREGAVFHSKITNIGSQDILEFGFVWDTIDNPTIEVSEKYIFPYTAEVGNYNAKVSTGLIALQIYYVRAFVRNRITTTYGETTSFISQGGKLPEITSISPALANLGDTLVIVGKYFSTRNSIVKINKINTKIVKSNQDSIYFIVPTSLTKRTSAVTLTNQNQTIIAKDSFTLISPIISNFESKTGTYGDKVTITGKNFLENPSTIKILFDKSLAAFDIIDDETINATVPSELDQNTCNISISMNNLTTQSVDKYSLLPVEISDFNPKIVLTEGAITITGNYFNPIVKKNKVYIGGVLAKSESVTKNTLTVTLSAQDTAVYANRNATVKIEVAGNIRSFENKLLINDKWFRRADAPKELYSVSSICSTCPLNYDNANANCFVIGNIAYIGLHNKKAFWAYDTDKNTWRKLSDFPGVPRFFGTGFVYGNKIYFGTGMTGYYSTNQTGINDWWEYNTITDSWLKKNNFPLSTYNSMGFSNDEGCFMSNGYKYTYNESLKYFTFFLYALKYDTEKDSWDNQIIGSWIDNNNSSMNFWLPCKAVENKVYVNLGIRGGSNKTSRIYILDSKNTTMQSIVDYPININADFISFYINGKIYLRKKINDGYAIGTFYYYDEVINKWKFTQTDVYSLLSNGIAFDVDNIGFVGLGESNHLYEFDPNR